MDNQCTVQVKLELGHRAQLRKKPTTEGFTHDWMVFVCGPEQCEIQHFVEKVVFRLHDSFPKPKRVCKKPPYKVEESGHTGFIMPIEVYFKNKEELRKVCFTYDLFLNLEGNPPVSHLRCEKLTFNNPTFEFQCKLLRAGGVMVMPEGAETVSRPSPSYPMLPTIPLSAFSDPKKTKPSHSTKDTSKENSETSEPHRMTKELHEREERQPAFWRPYNMDGQRDDVYWSEGKRAALEDRYRSDFPRPEHCFHDFDHRGRGQYQDHVVDRRESSRSVMGEREGQHYSDERHSHGGPPECHSRDSRDSWGGLRPGQEAE